MTPLDAAPVPALLLPVADVPIWAGIGLILLSAVAGTAAARARNRRRMRRDFDERRDI